MPIKGGHRREQNCWETPATVSFVDFIVSIPFSFFRRNGCPCGVRVERFNCGRSGRSELAKILLPHEAVLIDHEGHDSACTVVCGVRDQREALRQSSVDQVVSCAAVRSLSLRK